MLQFHQILKTHMPPREHAIYNEQEVRGPKAPPKPRAHKEPLKKVEINVPAEPVAEIDETGPAPTIQEAINEVRRVIRVKKEASESAKSFVAKKKIEEEQRKAEKRAKLEKDELEEKARKDAALAGIAKAIEGLGDPAMNKQSEAEQTAKQIEDTKRILGQENAAHIWDTVMPMFWKRDLDNPKKDQKNQAFAVEYATDYVHHVAEAKDKYGDNPAELHIAINKLNKNFTNLGLRSSYHPFEEENPQIEAVEPDEAEAKRIRKQIANEEGPTLTSREATEAEQREVDIAIEADDWSKKRISEALENVDKSAAGLRKLQENEKERQKRESTLEAKLEKKYGIDPFLLSQEMYGDLDAETINAALADPLYKEWVQKFHTETMPEAASSLRKRSGMANLLVEPNLTNEEREARLEKGFFDQGDLMSEHATQERSDIISSAKDLKAEIEQLTGAKNALQLEIKKLERQKKSTSEYKKRFAKLESDIAKKIKLYNEEVSRVEPETGAIEAHTPEEKRNDLIKLNEALTKKRMSLLAESPINRTEVQRVSEQLNETINKLRALEDPFNKTMEPEVQKPPVMERVRNFFKSLFGGNTEAEHTKEVDLSQEEFFAEDNAKAKILSEESFDEAPEAVEATELSDEESKQIRKDVANEEGPELTDVKELSDDEAEAVEQEAGTKTLMELAKNKDFTKANIRLGESYTQQALSYFQEQRGFDYKKTAYDATVIDADQAAEFVIALADYIDAREKGINRVPASTVIRNIGKDVGIPDLLQFAQKLAAEKEGAAHKRKSSNK